VSHFFAPGIGGVEKQMLSLARVSAIGGLGEIVGEGGLLFPTGDAGALASRMRQALLDPSLAQTTRG